MHLPRSFDQILILIYLIENYLTIDRYYYKALSGNGNPSLLAIFLLIPLLIWFSFHYMIFVRKFNWRWPAKMLLGLFSVLLDIWGIRYQREQLALIRNEMVKFHPYSEVMTHTAGLTIYTNQVYFNFLTLFMFLMIITSIGVLLKPKKLGYRLN